MQSLIESSFSKDPGNASQIRLKMRPNCLEDSLPAAESAQDGSIEPQGDVYSTQYGCPLCGYVLDELEPRIFSFNNPRGACPSCNGLGYTSRFDEDRIVVTPKSSIESGALAEWNSRHGYYYSMLESLARHYQFDLGQPFESLPERIRNIVLHGSGTQKISMKYLSQSGKNLP